MDNVRQIGPYRILRLLGEGGVGKVYEVADAQGKHYALKAFAPRKGAEDLLRKKFLAEAKIMSALDDPRIVKVHDSGEDPATGASYFVMDLVLYKDGLPHTLDDVDTSDLDEDFLKMWFEDLCLALDYIHSKKIIHRDIKCGNVLLKPDKHVVLSDFGISRVYGVTMARVLDVTRTIPRQGRCAPRTKFLMGTSGYEAPEIAAGQMATPASDVYSLGVMFFYLLTGIWYEPKSAALELLDMYDYRWNKVLPWMLEVNPTKRPYKVAGLPRLLPRIGEGTK